MLHTESKTYIDCSFLFYVDPIIDDKVNAELRDYTVKNLQILNKVFFELPIDVFVKSVSLIDRFISRVKVWGFDYYFIFMYMFIGLEIHCGLCELYEMSIFHSRSSRST